MSGPRDPSIQSTKMRDYYAREQRYNKLHKRCVQCGSRDQLVTYRPRGKEALRLCGECLLTIGEHDPDYYDTQRDALLSCSDGASGGLATSQAYGSQWKDILSVREVQAASNKLGHSKPYKMTIAPPTEREKKSA